MEASDPVERPPVRVEGSGEGIPSGGSIDSTRGSPYPGGPVVIVKKP
jgi:hypothetical protein